MPRIRPTEEFLAAVREACANAKDGTERKKIIDEARASFDFSYSYMTRILELRIRNRALTNKERERGDRLEEYTRKVYEFKVRADFDQKTFTIKTAYEALLEDGQIPSDIPLSAIRRKAREIGLTNEYKSPPKKYKGPASPRGQYQIDYSKSEYFHFRKDGQIFIQNPVVTKKDESRLYIGAVVDYTSRVCWFSYFMAQGESVGFVRDVMLKAFEEKPIIDEETGEIVGHLPLLQGIPKTVYTDRGPGNQSEAVMAGLMKLGVTLIIGNVEIDSLGRKTNRSNKKARGLVEKFIGDFKRGFEAKLWAKKLLGNLPPDFTLLELNELALSYCQEINQKTHPILKDKIRWELFAPTLADAQYPPAEAKGYFGGRKLVTVCDRMVRGNKEEDKYIVPSYINDGDKVDVVTSGKDCYLYRKGKMIKLRPQAGSIQEMMEADTGAEFYHGFDLQDMLASEIDILSAGKVTLRVLPESFDDDLKEFYERPRTLAEVKEKARYFIMAVTPEKSKKKQKIIPFTPPPKRPGSSQYL